MKEGQRDETDETKSDPKGADDPGRRLDPDSSTPPSGLGHHGLPGVAGYPRAHDRRSGTRVRGLGRGDRAVALGIGGSVDPVLALQRPLFGPAPPAPPPFVGG